MTAYNVVRNRVRPGREKDFERAIRNIEQDMPGWRKLAVIKTGERTYCLVGEWDNMESIVAARPKMIKSLDGFRDMLEDLGGGLGVTDPVSGEAVVEIAGGK
jgi:Antibiotic biosynthesis monooxygenase